MSKATLLITSSWREKIKPYAKPSSFKSWYQFSTTILLFLGTLFCMHLLCLAVSPFLAIPLSLLAGGLLVRLFIIQHDCGHNSFFSNRTLNKIMGRFCAYFTFTPFAYWKKSHNIHHSHTGNLDQRGIGDVKTLTVEEYHVLPWYNKMFYRLYRHPLILFTLGPSLLFVVLNRIPDKYSKGWKERLSVHSYNILLVGGLTTYGIFGGWLNMGIVIGSTIVVATTLGTWLFYVQHQFEAAYWTKDKDWTFAQAALQGSSYYKLPAILHWFSGNIGFHHIHHLAPSIPNYNLAPCHKNNDFLHQAPTLTIATSLKSIFSHLWDYDTNKLISFSAYRKKVKAGYESPDVIRQAPKPAPHVCVGCGNCALAKQAS